MTFNNKKIDVRDDVKSWLKKTGQDLHLHTIKFDIGQGWRVAAQARLIISFRGISRTLSDLFF